MKQEMEEKGSSMSDGGVSLFMFEELNCCCHLTLLFSVYIPKSTVCPSAPVVKIKQSLTKLKQEIVQMDVRIGVVEHTLLQAKLKEKSNMTRDMHATSIPEPAAGPFV